MKIIRWGGLLAFIAIFALVFIIIQFFLDSWIKAGVETFASRAVGAEVNVASVQHSYSPFGVQFRGIQVTDPQQPSHNKIQLDSLEAKLDLSPLMLRKVIIDDLSAEGLQFGVARAKPGKLYTKEESAEPEVSKESAGLPKLDAELPSVDSLLAKYPLKTQQAGESLKATYDKYETELSEQYAALPDEKALEEYKVKIKALTDSKFSNPEEFLAAQKQLKALKAELKAEKKKIDQFKENVSSASEQLQNDIKQLEAAPQQDLDKFKGMLGGDLAAISGITELVFGEQAKVWAERLFAAYDFLVPFLQSSEEQVVEKQREQGRWIDFADTQGLPQFLVRKANISLLLEGESIASHWKDITSEHDVLGRATVYSLASNGAKQWQALAVEGDFWMGEEGIDAKQSWTLNALQLKQLPLEFDQVISGELQQALMDSAGSLSIKKGMLDGAGTINLNSLSLDAKGENKLGKAVADMLKTLDTLAMSANIGGEILSPSLSLSSDLDSKLGDMLSSKLGEEGEKRMAELDARLSKLAGEQLGSSGEKVTEWQEWQDMAQGKSNSIEKMMKAEVDSALDKEKDKLEDELRKRLFN
ncbi:TIGR03545 family protein [Alteromonadaceae bacterium Bs31]|nr:TIGR03545 family protein [Alteromonadaceae bacterium Bs31]